MLFYLKKFKRFFLLLSLFFIVFSTFKKGGASDFDDEEIACQDLTEAFSQYEQDNQLYNHSLHATLTGITGILKRFSDERKVTQEDLLKMIADLEGITNLISENQLHLITQSDNILFSLEECLKNP